MMQW